jgi:hypothetical protein
MPKYSLGSEDVKILRDMREKVHRLEALIRNSRGLNVGAGLSVPLATGGVARIPVSKEGLIPVALTQTGGSAGTSSVQCSFTYTVKDINSIETLGTSIAMTGNGQRVVNAAMTAGTYGLAYRGGDGLIKLIWADERISQTNC